MRKLIIVFVSYCFGLSVLIGQTQNNDSIKRLSEKSVLKDELNKLINSKHLMKASLGVFQSKPSFINKAIAAGPYRSYWYHDGYFILGVGTGNFLKQSDFSPQFKDTVAFNDLNIGANFAFKKLSVGRRLWDIKGILLSPQIGATYNRLYFDGKAYSGIKIIPSASLQFPYFAIDARLNVDIRGTKSNPNLKGFAVYPEIGFRLDGLYNIFDPTWVQNGHYEGTKTWNEVSYRTESSVERNLDGSMTIYETTIKTTTTKTENYNFDDMARNVGPFLAVGPRVCFNNQVYSGKTFMAGIGYHARMPMFGADFTVDFGKLGFASSYQNKETISNPKPSKNKINKNDIRFTGTYNATRIGGRGSVDLIDVLTKLYYRGHSEDAGKKATKFTRIIGGVGGGYAIVSKPHFDRSYANQYFDSLYTADYTALTTPYNAAKYGENTPFFTWFVCLEVGAVQCSVEWYRYKYAPLANVQTITIGYMLPYKRIIKRFRTLKTMKQQLKD